MKDQPREEAWNSVQAIVAHFTEGASVQDILNHLANPPPRRTLQYWIKQWVKQGRLHRTGERRGVRYFLVPIDATTQSTETDAPDLIDRSTALETQAHTFPYSGDAHATLTAIRKPLLQRQPVGYDFAFLNNYRPNETTYLTTAERAHLSQLGQPMNKQPAAGTFARQLLNRLLIDLSWNSSRLEGNTYSLLDTRRLIAFGAEAEGKAKLETQMIINHKEAIEFLVESAEDIGFNRYTLLNLHGLLSNNLLPDPEASGRLRYISIGIGHSTFQPLDVPQLINDYFDQLLQTTQAIHDPFEQAFFLLVQLPYLQPFDDVNKRVSRLAANIPFLKHDLIPLSFTDLPKSVYTETLLSVYELNAITPLKEVFLWAYERSAAHYQAVQQTLGEPDAMRLRYREEFKTVISSIVTQQLHKKAAYNYLAQWVAQHIAAQDQKEFQTIIENELLGLHAGNFARYRIRPKTFADWQAAWSDKTIEKPDD